MLSNYTELVTSLVLVSILAEDYQPGQGQGFSPFAEEVRVEAGHAVPEEGAIKGSCYIQA